MDMFISLLSDFESLCTRIKANSIIVLAGSNVYIIYFFRPGGWSTHFKIGYFLFGDAISTCMFIGTRTSCYIDFFIPFFTNCKRFGVMTKFIIVVILTRSDVDVSTLSKGTWSGFGLADIYVINLFFSQSIGPFWRVLSWASSFLNLLVTFFLYSK